MLNSSDFSWFPWSPPEPAVSGGGRAETPGDVNHPLENPQKNCERASTSTPMQHDVGISKGVSVPTAKKPRALGIVATNLNHENLTVRYCCLHAHRTTLAATTGTPASIRTRLAWTTMTSPLASSKTVHILQVRLRRGYCRWARLSEV